MKRIFALLLICLFLSANTGCERVLRVDKFAVVKEQCHLYKDPSVYQRSLSIEKEKDAEKLSSFNKSENVKWIYKGFTVYVTHEKGQLVKVVKILPKVDLFHSWWIPKKDLDIKKSFYQGFWDVLFRF